MKKREQWIDALKGIGILGIILTHCGTKYLDGIFYSIATCASNGVELFLLISAYLSFESYSKCFIGKKWDVIRGLGKCWIRIIPMYYFALLIIGIATGGSEFWLGTEEKIHFGNALMHIFLLHGLVPHYANSIIGLEWYIGVLAIMYLLVPIIYRICDSLGKSVFVFCVVSIVSYKVDNSILNYVANREDVAIYWNYFDRFWILAQLPVILLGVILFHCKKMGEKGGNAQKKWMWFYFDKIGT